MKKIPDYRLSVVNLESGISLVESLLVVVIIGSIVFLLANIPNAMLLISKSRHLSLAREIAVRQVEDKRAISYENIGLGLTQIDDSRLGLLPEASGTIIVGVLDEETPEPDDWIPCNSSLCPLGEKVKQVKVTVNWVDNNKPQTFVLDTMIGEGGVNQ